MKTFIDEARYLFLESTGWLRLTWRDRWVVIYFALSLCAVCIIKEAPVWVWIAVAVNFIRRRRRTGISIEREQARQQRPPGHSASRGSFGGVARHTTVITH